MAQKSPEEVLASLAETSRNVKFGRGVVSKTSYVAGLIVAAWLAIAFRITSDLVTDSVLLIAGFVATVFGFWYIKATLDFAEKNPAQALLDGAELVEWRRLEIAARGIQPPEHDTLEEIGQPIVIGKTGNA